METLFTFKIIMIIFGGCLLIYAAGLIIQEFKLKSATEKVEGKVIDLKQKISSKYDGLVCPEIEYELNGKIQKAHYYSLMIKDAVNFEIGDTVTVLINPKRPSVFKFENGHAYEKSGLIALIVFGIVMIAVGLII